MGTGLLPSAVDGTVIPSTDHNSIKDVLTEDLVPRNISGVATAVAGLMTACWWGGREIVRRSKPKPKLNAER